MLGPSQVIENLRLFRNPFNYRLSSIWPPGRRSAVIVLLFIGDEGELRVLLTKRSRKLRSFSGQVSLPGGKADSPLETFDSIARREAMEEIGLPMDSNILQNQYNMKLEKISSEIPCYMSKTLLSVKPVVYFLYNSDCNNTTVTTTNRYVKPLKVMKFFGKLNPGETSSLFSIPINDLIYENLNVKQYEPEYINKVSTNIRWGGLKWNVKHFHYHVDNHRDVTWLNRMEDLSVSTSTSEYEGNIDSIKSLRYRDVWGLTAKIIADVATIGNGLNVEDCSKRRLGHEELIYGLHDLGHQFQPNGRSRWEKSLINSEPGIKYSDVLPENFMAQLKDNPLPF